MLYNVFSKKNALPLTPSLADELLLVPPVEVSLAFLILLYTRIDVPLSYPVEHISGNNKATKQKHTPTHTRMDWHLILHTLLILMLSCDAARKSLSLALSFSLSLYRSRSPFNLFSFAMLLSILSHLPELFMQSLFSCFTEVVLY